MRTKFYRSAFKLSSTYAVGSIAQNALTVLLVPLYTGYLSVDDFGVLALLMLTVKLLTRLVWPPLAAAMARSYYKPDYVDKQADLIFNLLALLLVKSLILTSAYWCVRGFVADLLELHRDLLPLVELYALVLLLDPLQKFSLAVVRFRKKGVHYVTASLASMVVSTGLIVYLMAFAGQGLYAVAWGRICALVTTILLCLPVLIANLRPRWRPSILKVPLAYGYPLLVNGYSNLIIQSGDRYVLLVLSSVGTVGLYTFGYKIASLIQLVLIQPLANSLTPLFAQKESDPVEQRSLIRNCTTYYYVVGLMMALILSVFAKEVAMLFGRRSEYWVSWVIVPVIAFSYVQHGLGRFVGWGMVMAEKSFLISAMTLATAALNIGLNFVFIPIWGLLGAAFATLIAYLAWNGLKMYFSAKFYDLHFDLRRLIHVTVVGVALYAVAFIPGTGAGVSLNVSMKVLLVLAFPVVLLASGFFLEAERKIMRDMWRTIRTDGMVSAIRKLIGPAGTPDEPADVEEQATDPDNLLAD